MLAQPLLGLGGLARALQLGLRSEDVVPDAELREIRADHVHHGGDRPFAEQVEPFTLRRTDVFLAEFGGQRLADRHEVIAGIVPFGNLADVFAERLAVTQVDRAGERLNLRPGIVDVIFPRHLVAGEFEQGGQRIADHRTAAVAHVHRTGRVGRNVFDIDPPSGADGRAAIAVPEGADRSQFGQPGSAAKAQVDETGASDIGAGHRRVA